MGGQACIFYGAAEFSRDTDIVLLATSQNLKRLSLALSDLLAECIAVPLFSGAYLKKGHAVHFKCHHSDAQGSRLDVMSSNFTEVIRDDIRHISSGYIRGG